MQFSYHVFTIFEDSLCMCSWSIPRHLNCAVVMAYIQWTDSMLCCWPGLIHIVPEALAEEPEVDGLNEYPLGMAMTTTGFMVVFFIERVLFKHQHEHSKGIPISRATNPTATLLHTKPMDNVEASQDAEENDLKYEKDPNDSANNFGGKLETVSGNSFLACLSSIQGALLLLVAFSAHGILEGIILGLQVSRRRGCHLFASTLCSYTAHKMDLWPWATDRSCGDIGSSSIHARKWKLNYCMSRTLSIW